MLFLLLLPAAGCCADRAAGDPGIADVFDAARILKDVAIRSELEEAPGFPGGGRVCLKLENKQHTGAFKLRGAYYRMSKLSGEQRKRGVVTCSAGNHAQGVGFAADRFGIKATIFLPAKAPATKIAAVRAYRNVRVELVDGSFGDAQKAAADFQRRTNTVCIPPFDDRDIIAGQGTVGWEILNQLPETDIIVVPVGGGGLISGIAVAARALKPSCRICGVQAEGAPAMADSLKAGRIVTLDKVSTLADGTAVNRPGQITFDLCRRYVDGIVTVSEAEIEDAIRLLYRKYGVTAEGAGALSAAAVMSGKIPSEGKNVVCVISGGNIDRDKLDGILAKEPQGRSRAPQP